MKAIREIKKVINKRVTIELPDDFDDKEVEIIVLPAWEIEQEPDFIRNHDAFLRSYSVEDEGLYDEYKTR